MTKTIDYTDRGHLLDMQYSKKGKGYSARPILKGAHFAYSPNGDFIKTACSGHILYVDHFCHGHRTVIKCNFIFLR